MTTKDHTCLAELAWWIDGCLSYLGTSVHPPIKMPNFEKITLCLNPIIFKGGLTFRHIFSKFIILENFVILVQLSII